MTPTALISPGTSNAPPRVQAAQDFLYFCKDVEDPGPGLGGEVPQAGREMSKQEQATKAAALQVLMQYFNGEMDFGDAPPSRGDNDPPMNPTPKPEPVTK